MITHWSHRQHGLHPSELDQGAMCPLQETYRRTFALAAIASLSIAAKMDEVNVFYNATELQVMPTSDLVELGRTDM